ncbi:M20/M25/M40 family metallo-hydrolase [Candidatus Gottesmanbacteria bacterium]|nr:M20/M25/M40 family metallo-hydrolase [Candidatus Gottesmanbacteria bacterium]
MVDELFQKLVAIPSISGNESLFQKLVAKELSAYSEIKFADILNNFTVQVGQGPQKVLITAHADEVGFIITFINDEGFIYFQPVGGIDADIAVGQAVNIHTSNGIVPGIIGREEVWDTASTKESEKSIPYKDLWIDIGANKKAAQLVAIGDTVTFDTSCKVLQDSFILARGADDKLGVYALIQLIHTLSQKPNPNVSLYAVTTTQEEVGSRGAQPAVNHIQPKYSIIIDTIRATDTPIADKEEIGRIVLGEGPVITRGSNTNPDLFFILKEIAKRESIPYQVEADAGPTATDADPIQISGIGTATIVVGIPVRYTHFPGELFCWNDVVNCIKLLTCFLKSLRESVE